ncbi:MAG: hypothetical protein AB7N71_01535 [Phycisphaerae bacterium]
MRRTFLTAVAMCSCISATFAQPVIDGSLDTIYCDALAVQDTQTGFGNASNGMIANANGSELDNAYATIIGGTLYLFIGGNLEGNGNDLEIFFDTRAGGQNRLLQNNPMVDTNNALIRMGDNGTGNGLSFDPGFTADFYITFQVSNPGAGHMVFVNYAELADGANPGVGFFVGSGGAANTTMGGMLSGGDVGAPAILATINNSNVAGVSGGFGVEFDGGANVATGIELAIPLSALGNPAADIRVTAFVNGAQHDFLSNQSLAPQFGGTGNNLGEPRNVNFANISFDQFFTIPLMQDACGACCFGTDCVVTDALDCMNGGTYLGDNASCVGNPCDQNASGACCVGAACTEETLGDCNLLGGFYIGDDSVCGTFPCQSVGACCMGDSCTVLMEEDCMNMEGDFLGGGTTCVDLPCATGSCCIGVLGDLCVETREEDCIAMDGRYAGDGSDCISNPCVTGACCVPCGACEIVTGMDICVNVLNGTYNGDGSNCGSGPCGPVPGGPAVNGFCESSYGAALAVQDTQTQFGDSNLGQVDFANGSELDSLSAQVVDGKLYLCFAGNVETNFNKFELFFDTREGGQNTIGSMNPDVDFGALQRLGDDGTGNGFTFDAGFDADFYLTFGMGGTAPAIFANYVEMFIDEMNPGTGLFLGEGRPANKSNNGLLDRNAGGNNPFGIRITVDNSNTAGVSGGDMMGDGSGVNTGIEICVPLSAIGDPKGDFKITAFINGQGHDFSSNQYLAGLGGGGNLADPRNVDLSAIPGDQCITISQSGGCNGVCADANCDGVVTVSDIGFFVTAVAQGEAAWNAAFPGGSASCGYCVNDTNGDGFVTVSDIGPFVNAVTSGGCQ